MLLKLDKMTDESSVFFFFLGSKRVKSHEIKLGRTVEKVSVSLFLRRARDENQEHFLPQL